MCCQGYFFHLQGQRNLSWRSVAFCVSYIANCAGLVSGQQDVDLLLPELQFLPSTKIREKDPILRTTHLETLILLCTTRWGRDRQRRAGVYEIIRMMHETEIDDNVSA